MVMLFLKVSMQLNKFLAHAGICSRRQAVEYIKAGKVMVNGIVITQPGHRVAQGDKVLCDGKKVMQEELVYILLNKPKDYITTVADERGRKTVLELIKPSIPERIYPVGRLDRNTTGLLVLTNDGEFTQLLAHPKHEIYKIYHVTLDAILSKNDFQRIIQGVELEDGTAHIDDITWVPGQSHKQLYVALHSGKNRIIRRLFEHLGYEVKALDRVEYAGLTKSGLQRGEWRYLTQSEIKSLRGLK
jgi:23S rRNA pseudouridine2605 synthase